MKTGKLSSFALKRIAVCSMIVDHIGGYLLKPYYMAHYATAETQAEAILSRNWYYVIETCNAIGSIAFPLFAFMIAQGFIYTSNPKKYSLRLFLFALLSEIPFNLVHFHSWHNFELQNVMFTLGMGALTLYGISLLEKETLSKKKKIFATVGLTLVGMGLAFAIRGEYVFLGVLAIVLFYVLREQKYWKYLAFIPLLVPSLWCALAFIPIFFYNGTRGKGKKYFFYIFYPAHFLILYGIQFLIQ